MEAAWSETNEPGTVLGMTVDDGEDVDDDDDIAAGSGERPPQKPTVRKTKQQRQKAERQKAEASNPPRTNRTPN